MNTLLRRSGMAHILKVSHSFTCTPRSSANGNEPYLPCPSQLKLVLIGRPRRDGRLSQPGGLVTYFATVYLADDCHLLSDAGRRPLRSHSNDIRKLLVPRTHNKLGDRSFSAGGPRLWNDLSPGLRRPGLSFDSFRRSLKTHLFGD